MCITRIILRPFRALNKIVILYPGRCPGLKNFPLSGEICFSDALSEYFFIIDNNSPDIYLEKSGIIRGVSSKKPAE